MKTLLKKLRMFMMKKLHLFFVITHFKKTTDTIITFLRKIGILKKMDYFVEYYFKTKDDMKELLLPMVLRVSSERSLYRQNDKLIDAIRSEYYYVSNIVPRPIMPDKFIRNEYIRRYNIDFKKGRNSIIQLGLPKPNFPNKNMDINFTEKIKLIDEEEVINDNLLNNSYKLREFPVVIINENKLPIDTNRMFPVIFID